MVILYVMLIILILFNAGIMCYVVVLEHKASMEYVSSGKIWVTSDLHLGHRQPFLYEPRGYDSAEEMVVWVVTNWNRLVADDDDVYVLGDLMLNDDESIHKYFCKLKGHIHVIVGNHDTDRRIELYKSFPNIVEVVMAKRLRYKKFHFYLSHYPTLVGNFDDGEKLYQKTINLCGHSHTTDPFADWDKGTIYHCELDAHNNQPVLLDDIITDLKNKINSAS